MENRPQLLVVDLDGTLLDAAGGVSEANCRALKAAREARVRVMVATGRIVPECRTILERIEYAGPLVIASGAAMVDWPSGRTVMSDPMPVGDVEAVVDIMSHHRCTSVILKDGRQAGYDYVLIDDIHLHPISRWWFEHHGMEPRVFPSTAVDPHPHATLRVACLGTPTRMAEAAATLQADLGDRINSRHWPAVGPEGVVVHMLEVFGPVVDKWTMIERYCRNERIDIDQVAAIGDGLNDLELLQGVGFGIAVANAGEDVRQVADAVTGHHRDDGVAHAVHRLLGGWS